MKLTITMPNNSNNPKPEKPKRAKRIEITALFGNFTLQGEHLMALDLKPGQSFDFTVKPLNSKGTISPVDGPIVMTITGETSVDVFFDEPNRTGKVSYLDVGAWTVTFSADADLDPTKVRTITGSIAGTNGALEATSLVIEPGPIVP